MGWSAAFSSMIGNGGSSHDIASIGIDIGKTTFHLVALNEHGGIVVRKKVSRSALLTYTANLSSSLIGMETCGGAHLLARALRDQRHDARWIAAKFVKPYRKSNKNDYRDAEAIAEAVSRKNMRFVPIKTDEQLDLQRLHRVRARLVRNRTNWSSHDRDAFLSVELT